MKKFIIQALVFLVPILVLAFILEITLRNIPNDYKFKKSQIQLEKESIKTLILGSSHSLYGFNPEYFNEKAFNLAHVSQTIDLDYYMLEKYIEELPQLETVVMRLSYTTLHEQIGKTTEAWRLKDYNLYYNLNVSNKLKYQSEILSVKLKNNTSRFKDYYLNDKKMITVDKSGWAFFDQEHSNEKMSVLGFAAARKHKAKDIKLVKKNVEFLEKIVKLCNKENVNLLLITTPTHKRYRENLNKPQLETVLLAGEKMNNKYSNCRYFNLLDNQSFTDVDFYDADHLNRYGAKKLSIIVDEFISQPFN